MAPTKPTLNFVFEVRKLFGYRVNTCDFSDA